MPWLCNQQQWGLFKKNQETGHSCAEGRQQQCGDPDIYIESGHPIKKKLELKDNYRGWGASKSRSLRCALILIKEFSLCINPNQVVGPRQSSISRR